MTDPGALAEPERESSGAPEAESDAKETEAPAERPSRPPRRPPPARGPTSERPAASERWLTMAGKSGVRPGAKRRSPLGRAADVARDRRVLLGLALIAIIVAIAAPYGMVALGTKRARECLARYREPRGPARPDCRREVEWFVQPSRLPVTRARHRAEELLARIGIEDYADAAIGTPDRAALTRAADDLRTAEGLVRRGSQRLELDELGPAVGFPNLGRMAYAMGDRKTLLERYDEWPDWRVRHDTLEAALLEGDLPLAARIAKRYAEFDPRDEDLRSEVATVLCLRGDPKVGMDLFEMIQAERAGKRHANFTRAWGEVRAAIVACASKLRTPPPPRPLAEAGLADMDEARAVMRVRRTRDGPEAEREAQLGALALLKAAPRTSAGRRALLASLLASPYELDPAEAADVARARLEDGERPLADGPAITAVDILAEPVAMLRPVVSPATFARAAERLLGASQRDQAKGPPSVEAPLRNAAGALLIEAGATMARSGDGGAAERGIDEGAKLAGLDAAGRALARSSARFVALDYDAALAALDAAQPAEGDDEPARRVRAAWWIQRAELLAALGKRPEAREAIRAAEAPSRATSDARLGVRARWIALALADRSAVEPAAPPQGPLTDAASRPWPWVGFADARAPWARPPGDARVDEALLGWRQAIESDDATRRAYRYAALGRRGDAPLFALTPYLAVAAELAKDAGDAEVWLDAFGALDAKRVTARSYAWARAQAARWRGDAPAAAAWEGRYKKLCEALRDERDGELAAILRL